MPQPFHAGGPFKAGYQQPQRVTLLRTDRLAILSVGHDDVVHGLSQRKRVTELALVRPFRNQPTRSFLHAGLVQQHRERHAGPFTAARHPMDVLDTQTHLRIVRTMERGRAVSMAFHEINPVYDGSRFSSSRLKLKGRSTMPWIVRRCCWGSMSGRWEE